MATRKPPGIRRNPYALVVWVPPLQRPRSRYDIMRAVCERVEDGALLEDAAYYEGIDRRTVWRWQREHPSFGDMYARAREASAETLESEAIRVARSVNPMPGRFDARLLVDTLKWAAAKRRPHVYSDRVEHVVVEDPRTLPRAEVEKKANAMRRRLRLA